MKQAIFIIFTSIIFSTISDSQTKWISDKSHSMINFSVSHFMISEVTGQFKDFTATMESSNNDFSDAKIDVTIKAKSVDTGTERRDNHLRSTDFFNAEVDSIITFTSSQIEKTGENTYKIYGVLNMRGISKEVELDTKFMGLIRGNRGTIAAFKATTSIARKEWGIAWNRVNETGVLTVGEIVDLTINIEFSEVIS